MMVVNLDGLFVKYPEELEIKVEHKGDHAIVFTFGYNHQGGNLYMQVL